MKGDAESVGCEARRPLSIRGTRGVASEFANLGFSFLCASSVKWEDSNPGAHVAGRGTVKVVL